jgi:hypothetical protein
MAVAATFAEIGGRMESVILCLEEDRLTVISPPDHMMRLYGNTQARKVGRGLTHFN